MIDIGRFETAVALTTRLAGLATLLNTLELVAMRGALSDAGIWRSATLAPAWGIMRPVLYGRAFAGVLAVQSVASMALLFGAGGPWPALVVMTTMVCSAMRMYGTVNGGSDGMLFTVLAGLALAQCTSVTDRWREAGLVYIAVIVTVSYVMAGLVKVRERAWWTGEALAEFLALPAYGVPPWVPRRGPLLQIASLGVMCFECLAPFAWGDPVRCAVVMGVGLTFHAGTVVVFGLNRFLFAWGAAYPALWYAATRVA